MEGIEEDGEQDGLCQRSIGDQYLTEGPERCGGRRGLKGSRGRGREAAKGCGGQRGPKNGRGGGGPTKG